MTDSRNAQPGSRPAGWFPSPVGVAAPPIRHTGPARSDRRSPWPALTRSPRPIPVLGPAETLRGHGRETSWQLAKRAWDDSGVAWEDPGTDWQEKPAPDADGWYPRTDDDLVDPHPTRHDLPVPPVEAAPPLPRRVRRASTEYIAASPFAPASPFALASPFAPSPAFAAPSGAPPAVASLPLSAPVAPPLSAPVSSVAPVASTPPSPAGPDELFRAWQGSVDQAVGRRTPRAARRPARARLTAVGSRTRDRGWQVVKVGVPAAVIVTVGASALMMLTGRANEMLAQRASSGTLSSGKPVSGPVASGQTSAGPASAADGLTLAGYPAGHGAVGVTALSSAGGLTVAVGYADGHPAVWRHAADGAWSLVSTALLGGLTGRLTAVTQGPSGWIAVGSADENGTAEPAVFGSANGTTWQELTALTVVAGSGARFLGVAAGPAGYLVVGTQGSTVALWWSNDLQSWANGETGAPPGSYATAAVATAGGFVAVGSESNCHTFWISADGQHWTAHDLAKPAGATAATLTSVAAGQGRQGDRFVAAGVATTSAGDQPVVVTAANDGTHISQTVLSSPAGSATVTAVTATTSGFLAVGAAGPANARRTVTWTSAEGRSWTPATALAAAGSSEITALTSTSAGSTLTATASRGATPAVLTFRAP